MRSVVFFILSAETPPKTALLEAGRNLGFRQPIGNQQAR